MVRKRVRLPLSLPIHPFTLLAFSWITVPDVLIKFPGRVCAGFTSPVRWWRVENPCRASGSVPVQVSQYRVHEQNLSPEHR